MTNDLISRASLIKELEAFKMRLRGTTLSRITKVLVDTIIEIVRTHPGAVKKVSFSDLEVIRDDSGATTGFRVKREDTRVARWVTRLHSSSGVVDSFEHLCPECKYAYRDLKVEGAQTCPNCGERLSP